MTSIDSQTEIERLRKIILGLCLENKKLSSQNVGLQNLIEQLDKKTRENAKLRKKVERLETTIARAENRIAQLSDRRGDGKAVVTPGVSKKILNALICENTKLKLALDHAKKGDVLTDIDAHQTIARLTKEVRASSEAEERYRAALGCTTDNELRDQVFRLTASECQLKRKFEATKIFNQVLMNENESLKQKLLNLNEASIDKIQRVSHLRDELCKTEQSREIKNVMDTVYG